MPTSKDLTDLDSQLKKTFISAESFKRGSYMDPSKSLVNIHKTLGTLAGHTRKLVIRVNSLEKTVNNNSRKITSLKNISKTQSERISGTNIGAKLPGSSTSSVEDNISAITKSVSSIAEILSGRKKLADDTAAYERRKAEQEKRSISESKLEKRFDGLKKVAEKVIAPVKSILDRIIDFFVTVFLGRVVYKLLEWFGDPKNAQKVNSIIRFLGDHWPKLLSLYLVFGTSFGRFAKGLLKTVLRGTFKLTALIFKLAAAKKIRGARKVAGFLGGGKGKLAANIIGTGLALGGTYAATQALTGDDKKEKTQAYRGGGYVRPRFPTFSGGGFNFKGMMGGASMGAMFGPLGMLLGGALGGKSSGFVSGEKGVDKVPAMLSDGEFVMSRGAVAKYGVDTLEAMNAAGGGTNKPKVISGTTYAVGGGPIGNIKDNPNYKDSILSAREKLVEDLQNYARTQVSSGGNINLVKAINNLSSTLRTNQSSNQQGKTPTGSLLTDPVGAIQRMTGMGGPKIPNMPSVPMPNISKPLQQLQNKTKSVISAVQSKMGLSKPSEAKPGEKGFFQEIQEKLTGSGAATYRDAGSIYAKQMLGGFGGPVSERDLSKESQQELQKAIQRAKKRTGSEIAKAEAKIKELRAQGAKDGNPALETQKSFLKKLKAGGIRVQYTDYADEKGQMSESAKNAKNILGQFWANERSKKEGGGYRIEDKYDFDMFKKKDEKTGKMRDMNMGELLMEGVLGKGKSTQQRLQAAYLMNPLRGKGDVDMVLGGKRTAAESLGLTGSKTLLGGMLGISGKPKDKNTKALESKRPWWDKAGWFGGGSRVAQEQAKKAQLAKKKPPAKPIKPPAKPAAKVVYGPPVPSKKNKKSNKSPNTKTPKFGATCPKNGNAKAKTLGIK